MLKPRSMWGMPLLGLLMAGAMASGSSAQTAYPTKAIQLVVAFAPGGGNDVAARIVSKHLSTEFKVPVNVVNMPGGNQITGTMAVFSKAPDGYTLLNDGVPTSTIHGIMKDLPYNMEERTFGPMYANGPVAFVVGTGSPWNSLKDVAEAGKKDPASLTWGRLGGYSNTDFSQLQFFDEAGIDIPKTKPVPFPGAGPAITAVAGGHVSFGNGGVGTVFPLLKAGKLKVLAITGEMRMPSLPDVPTTKEAGYPGTNLMSWWGISGPKGLPGNVRERIDQAVKKIIESKAFREDMVAVAYQPRYLPANQILEHVRKEMQVYKSLSQRVQR